MSSDRVRAVVAPILDQLGLELDRIDVVPAGRRRVVKVTVDRDGKDGHGPDLDEIAEATNAISHGLDDADAMGESPYTLEVTSRGVSTPLTEPRHFRRNVTRLVKLTLAGEPTEQLLGRILSADDEKIVVQVEAANSKPHKRVYDERMIDLTQIQHAVVQVELNRPTDTQEN